MSRPAVSEIALVHTPSTDRSRLIRLYTLEAFGSTGGSLLMLGIFFYMQQQFHFESRKNLLLSSVQGAVYVVGALGANPVSARIGKRTLLRALNLMMLVLSALGYFSQSSTQVVAVLLAYTVLNAAQWPLLESLVSSGADSSQLSKRISIYNLVWSGSGSLIVAVCGIIITRYPPGIFLAALGVHVLSVILLIDLGPDPATGSHIFIEPEPELLRVRTTAMRLSRVVLPATFAVLYALSAMMPTLKVIRDTSPETRTLLASVWMIARWLSFVMLGVTSWWHTRPRALLIAALGLLASFLGITLLTSVPAIICWQIVLGVCMGLIYSGSLYFGMVLSEGDAAHGGYHEALIGLGSILGPGAGFLAQTLWPQHVHASIAAVSVVLWFSIMISAIVSLGSRYKKRASL